MDSFPRYTVPSDHTMKPGPGAYSPEKVGNHFESNFDRPLTLSITKSLHQTDVKSAVPQYSFGVRHSDYMFGARPLPGEETRPLPY